jgi:hypothetical protein
MINHVFYSTSNNEYQNWQRDLLEYSFIKVNQPGQLWAYVSKNENNIIPRTKHIPLIEKEIECPDYMNFFDPKKKYGIANKFCSIKLWLDTNPTLEGSVLFLDPDMIFINKIDVEVKEGTIVGQLWVDKYIESHQHFIKYTPPECKHMLLPENMFMFPFCINVKDMRRIIEDYIKYTSIIYKHESCWEAEMFGLIIAALKSNLKIIGKNLGCCNNWKPQNQLNFNMVHYPGVMFNNLNEKIWFKQDFTKDTSSIPWTLNVTCDQTTNLIEYQLISTIKEYINIQKIKNTCPDMFYWNNISLNNPINSYNLQKKYIFCDPWYGGFNNVRMSFEIAASIAFRLNRILVVPDELNISHLHNINKFDTFFEINDIGINVITMNEFCILKHIPNDMNKIKEISTVYNFTPDKVVINIGTTSGYEKKFQNMSEVFIDNNPECILFDKNLLGNFYSVIQDDNIDEIKQYVCKHIHYKESIFSQAYNIIEYLNNTYSQYYSMHLRRTDFNIQYKDVCISVDDILKNIRKSVPQGSCLYISTDIQNKNELGELNSYYKVIVLSDVLSLLDKNMNKDLFGMIEQIVCARSMKFIGTQNSTFSTYIYRLRGYMKDINDKSYIINTSSAIEVTSYIKDCWKGNHNIWSREFTDGFDFINEKDTIFVSIASYRDSELEPTITDLFKKAKYPGRIIVGVCLQDTSEKYENFIFKDHKQVKILYINYLEAKGVCYARSLIQKDLLKDEKYYLQIDSHTRFSYNWDTNLINQLTLCPHDKPILSCYPNAYELNDNKEAYLYSNLLSKHKYNSFLNDTLRTSTCGIYSKELVPSGWIAAGFTFTYSSWCKEVGYPSNILFNGEEDYLFIKSFIKEYEIYCPPTCNIFHCYANNLSQSPNKYRPLVHEDINTSKLNCSNSELQQIISSMSDSLYEKFKNKYGVCYKTKKILPTIKKVEHIKIISSLEVPIIQSVCSQPMFKDIEIFKDKLNIFLWGISNDESYIRDGCKYALQTAETFNLHPQILGLNYDNSFLDHLQWKTLLSRLYLLRDVTIKDDINRVMVFMNGFDTLFNGNERQILEKFYKFNTKILFSSEKYFTYQWSDYKDKFDKIDSLYKYVNAGTIIGYSKDLYNMACECIQFLEKSNGRDRGNDQGILGKYIYEHMDDSKLILLDTNCEIFWVTSNDNDNLLKYGTHNVNTNTRPLILRVVVDGRESSELYKNTCNIIINA